MWAKALNRAGRLTEAIRVYELALQLDGGDLNNLREVVSLHNRNNTQALARPFLERLVALQPDDLVPKQDLARALEAAGDLAGAAAQYQTILAAAPGADLSRALLSEVYVKQNRSSDALRLLDEGLAANASAAILHREKGRVFDRLGRDGEALAEYREYVRLAPGATDVRAFKTRIEQLIGKLRRENDVEPPWKPGPQSSLSRPRPSPTIWRRSRRRKRSAARSLRNRVASIPRKTARPPERARSPPCPGLPPRRPKRRRLPVASKEDQKAAWKARADAARTEIAASQARLADLKREYAEYDSDIAEIPAAELLDPMRRQKREARMVEMRAQIEQQRQIVADAQKSLSVLETEARRNGIPPGWLRLSALD